MKYVSRVFEYKESIWNPTPFVRKFYQTPTSASENIPLPLKVDVLNGCLFDAFTEGSIMHRINHVSTITLFTPNSK